MPELEKVKGVFRPIFDVYDSMNTLMSLGLDVFWRIKLLKLMPGDGVILDIGTGTGKLFSLYKGKSKIIGLDITKEMLIKNPNKGNLLLGSGTQLPFKENKFDGIMSAFVLRNLPDTSVYFNEAYRVLKNGGIIANLDAFPENRWYFKPWFSLYFYDFMPRIGNFISGTNSYTYLADSVKNFKLPDIIKTEMIKAGFKNINIIEFKSPSAHLIYGFKI